MPTTDPMISMRVKAIRRESKDVKTFVLEPQCPKLEYSAGQFLTLSLPVSEEQPVMRTYSLSTCPRSDFDIAVTVKRTDGGVGSNWLYNQAARGMVLKSFPPAGEFTLDPAPTGDVLLFAAGVGITPLFSLFKSALTTTGRRVRLHYSCRSSDDAPFLEVLRRWQRFHGARVALDVVLTDERPRPTGPEVCEMAKNLTDPQVYVCGPASYTAMVVEGLVAAGVNPSAIRTESFGPPAAPPGPVDPTVDAIGHVNIEGVDAQVRWPADTPLLDALEAAGVRAPHSCRQGECLTCECRVTSGRTSMIKNGVLDEYDVAEGYALACQLVPEDPEVSVVFGS
jgi:3-ketosteroid 9alpha-monooxygenase subunit B